MGRTNTVAHPTMASPKSSPEPPKSSSEELSVPQRRTMVAAMSRVWSAFVRRAITKNPVPTVIALLMIGGGTVLLLLSGSDVVSLHEDAITTRRMLDGLYESRSLAEVKDAAILTSFVRSQHRFPWHTALTHISVALMTAGFLILVVEIHTATMLREEVAEERKAFAKDVWKAFSDRLVPGAIARELDELVKSEVCKYDVKYKITLMKSPYQDLPSGTLIVKREISVLSQK
jgi:hypothetical protein